MKEDTRFACIFVCGLLVGLAFGFCEHLDTITACQREAVKAGHAHWQVDINNPEHPTSTFEWNTITNK